MEPLSVYVPMDRRQALAQGVSLPDRTQGTVLFADVSGFTPLTAALVEELGPQRGAEELIRQLNQVYDTLIDELHHYGGSVIGFSGDAITCWLDGDNGSRGVGCGLAMQKALERFAAVRTPAGTIVSLGGKVAAVCGPVRRFLVGDPAIQRLEVVAGATMDRMAAAEKQALQGEVIVGEEIAALLEGQVVLQEWRGAGNERFAIITALTQPVEYVTWPEMSSLPDDVARNWIFPPVYHRLQRGERQFLAELRPSVALFLKFTGLNYDQDDEAGIKLDAYLRWVQRVVTRYEGYLVDLTVGDKGSYLYATFGAPMAHEDDPDRAVAAALALQSPPPGLSFIKEVQIGISRGSMRAGAIGGEGRRAYAVMGNEVNVAARLMGTTEPGQILVSKRVADAADRFQFQRLEVISLKGVPEPMPVFVPLGEKEGGESDTLKGRTLAPMVGRTAEISKLSALLRGLQEGRAGGVVVVEGEAGIGKSRLAADLLENAQEMGISTLLGAGQSIEQQTPYRAWRDVLSAFFDLGAATAPSERQQHFQTLGLGVMPDRLPLLNDVLPLGLPESELTSSLDPALRQQNLFMLLADLLRVRAEERSLVLVLEDVQWLDSLSWELALHVARGMGISGVPFLMVLVTRPLEEHATGTRPLAALQEMAETATMTLDTMRPEEMVTLSAIRLGLPKDGLPEAVASLVRERSGGNPFFAEELILALRDQELIRIDKDEQTGQFTCIVDGDLARISQTLPDTVQGLVLSRIDRLDPEQQLTLKVASVIGRVFSYISLLYTLQQHTSVSDKKLNDHLERLAVLYLALVETPEPDLTYIFKHITTQETAYQTLLFAQRRQIHHTVAKWYEVTYDTEEQLAPHLSLMVHHYHYADDERQERIYARLAGEHAAAQFANVESVRYLSRALELTPHKDLLERYDLLMNRERVHDLMGEREDQQRDLELLEDLTTTLADEQHQAEVALRRANYAQATGDYPATITAVQNAITLAQDARCEAMGYYQWGQALWLQGDFEAAHLQLQRSLNLAREANLRQVEANCLRNLGIVSYFQSDYAVAIDSLGQAMNIYHEINDRIGEAKAFQNLGNVAAEQRDYARARGYLEQALHINREIGRRRGEGTALANLGIISMEQGDYTAATAYCEQALHIQREIGDWSGVGMALDSLGFALFYLGQYTAAQSYFDQALETQRRVGNRQGEASSLSHLGLLFHNLGDDQAACEYSRQALQIARQVGDRLVEGEALTHLAHGLAGLGQLDEAVAAYRQGLAIRREFGEQSMAMESLAGLARVSIAQRKLAQAMSQVEEILAYLENHSLDGTYEPCRVYLTCYQVLRAGQDPRALEILSAAYNLLQERAALIEEEEMCRSFMENVAAHCEVMAERGNGT